MASLFILRRRLAVSNRRIHGPPPSPGIAARGGVLAQPWVVARVGGSSCSTASFDLDAARHGFGECARRWPCFSSFVARRMAGC
eukprot:10007599-Alexandrium_andersonii.AAC.1